MFHWFQTASLPLLFALSAHAYSAVSLDGIRENRTTQYVLPSLAHRLLISLSLSTGEADAYISFCADTLGEDVIEAARSAPSRKTKLNPFALYDLKQRTQCSGVRGAFYQDNFNEEQRFHLTVVPKGRQSLTGALVVYTEHTIPPFGAEPFPYALLLLKSDSEKSVRWSLDDYPHNGIQVNSAWIVKGGVVTMQVGFCERAMAAPVRVTSGFRITGRKLVQLLANCTDATAEQRPLALPSELVVHFRAEKPAFGVVYIELAANESALTAWDKRAVESENARIQLGSGEATVGVRNQTNSTVSAAVQLTGREDADSLNLMVDVSNGSVWVHTSLCANVNGTTLAYGSTLSHHQKLVVRLHELIVNGNCRPIRRSTTADHFADSADNDTAVSLNGTHPNWTTPLTLYIHFSSADGAHVRWTLSAKTRGEDKSKDGDKWCVLPKYIALAIALVLFVTAAVVCQRCVAIRKRRQACKGERSWRRPDMLDSMPPPGSQFRVISNAWM